MEKDGDFLENFTINKGLKVDFFVNID